MAGRRKLRRGIYLLPTTFPTGNLCCGFFSLIESARGHYEAAAILIIIAGVLDGLDPFERFKQIPCPKSSAERF